MPKKKLRRPPQTSEVLKTSEVSNARRAVHNPQISEVSKTSEILPATDAPYDLPDGWKRATLESVLENHRGGVWGPEAQGKKGYPVLRSTNMRGGKLDFSEVARCVISDDVAKATALKPGDIIVSKSSGSPHLVGLPALFESNPDGQTYLYSNFTMRLRPDSKQILPKFVFHFLAGAKAEADRRSMSQDTAGLRNLKTKEYLAQTLSLPPLPEQQRIITRIESLFAESRTARDALERVPALLKRFRQSVLASAFRGELTTQTSEVSDSNSPLPDGWAWVTVEAITKNFDGRRVPVKETNRKNLQGKYPYYGASGIIDHVNDYLFDGTFLLVGEDGANLLSRSTPIAFQASGKFWVNNHAHVLQTVDEIPLAYLEHYFNRIDLSQYVTGTAQPKLTQAHMNSIPIPLAPLAEQRRIVAKIESLFAQADAIERAVTIAQHRADKIDQSILARAFRGGL